MSEKSEKVAGEPTPPGAPEAIPMGECSRTQSQDHLSLRTESTIFSLSRTESPWATALPTRAWKFHRPAIILISTGGSMLLVGCVLSGLYFAEEYAKMRTNETAYIISSYQAINTTSNAFCHPRPHKNIFNLICGTVVGPPLVSIGLMVMMVGVVLIPVTREIRQQNVKRLFSYKAQHVNI